MTREQLERLAQLLTDTAQTASTIELRALAGGKVDNGIAAMASLFPPGFGRRFYLGELR